MIPLFQRRTRDPLIEAYCTKTPKRWPRKKPLNEVKWIALDAETTGFNRATDRVLSLAAVPLGERGLRISEMREWLVYQESHHANPATAVHGILPVQTRSGVPEREVLEGLLPMLSGAILVGHHIRFDAAMIDGMMRRHFGVGLRNCYVDTAEIAMQQLVAFHRTGYANQRPPSLEEVCAQLGVEAMERHTAGGDTITTSEIFLLFLGRLRQKRDRLLLVRDLPVRKL